MATQIVDQTLAGFNRPAREPLGDGAALHSLELVRSPEPFCWDVRDFWSHETRPGVSRQASQDRTCGGFEWVTSLIRTVTCRASAAFCPSAMPVNVLRAADRVAGTRSSAPR